MKKYVAKRLAISVLLIFIISVFSFMLIHILPGDPARLALGYEASEADVQAYRVELHLDKPLVTQYVLWIKGLFQGDLAVRSCITARTWIFWLSACPARWALACPPC